MERPATAAECDEITERVGGERLLELAGNPALTGFQAPKILWLAHNEPDAYARVASVLLPKDYVRLMLTGERATDASDAAGTLLLDVRARDWSAEILDALEIPREWMPSVHEGPEVTGTLGADLAAELGLPAGLPVAAGGGDNAAAAVGVGVVREGALSTSIGTSGVMFAHRDALSPDPSGRVHAFCHAVPGAWPPDVGDAVGGWLAELVARPGRRRTSTRSSPRPRRSSPAARASSSCHT